MVENLPNALSFEGFVTEHHELMKKLGALRNWWSELAEIGTPRFGELGNRVKELRAMLAAHFEIEETGGYLSAALAAAPQLAPRAAELEAQHRQFLDRLDDLCVRLCRHESAFPGWQAARDEVETIIADLRRHEHAENSLVQAAFGQEVGLGD
jgi:hypothetical protein